MALLPSFSGRCEARARLIGGHDGGGESRDARKVNDGGGCESCGSCKQIQIHQKIRNC